MATLTRGSSLRRDLSSFGPIEIETRFPSHSRKTRKRDSMNSSRNMDTAIGPHCCARGLRKVARRRLRRQTPAKPHARRQTSRANRNPLPRHVSSRYQQHATTPRINVTPRVMESSPSSDASSHVDTKPKSIMRELLAELHRQHAPLGLIRVADVVHALLPHAKHGTIELRPDAGTEFLKPEDIEVCPHGPRETVFAYARWTDTR